MCGRKCVDGLRNVGVLFFGRRLDTSSGLLIRAIVSWLIGFGIVVGVWVLGWGGRRDAGATWSCGGEGALFGTRLRLRGLRGVLVGVEGDVVVLGGELGGADGSIDELAVVLAHEDESAQHLRGHEGEDGGASGGDASLGEEDVEVAKGEVDALDGLEAAGVAGEDGGVVGPIAGLLGGGMARAEAGLGGGERAALASVGGEIGTTSCGVETCCWFVFHIVPRRDEIGSGRDIRLTARQAPPPVFCRKSLDFPEKKGVEFFGRGKEFGNC